MNIPQNKSQWNWTFLVGGQLVAILLYASWLIGPVRPYWDYLDKEIFLILNGTLATGHAWQYGWALANNRLFDLVPASCMLIMFLVFMLSDERKYLRKRLAIGIFIVIYSLAATLLLKETLCDLDRASPTMAMPELSIRLSELFPHIPLKDYSSVSFPGDHATVLLLYSAFLWFYGGKKYGIVALLFSALFSLPRLVGGGHWLTDNLVGGGFMFITIICWALYTPLHIKVVEWLEGKLICLGKRFNLGFLC